MRLNKINGYEYGEWRLLRLWRREWWTRLVVWIRIFSHRFWHQHLLCWFQKEHRPANVGDFTALMWATNLPWSFLLSFSSASCSCHSSFPYVLKKIRQLFASQVNDGVCDCCDGTDEYNGRITCKNDCLEMGREALQETLQAIERTKQGIQIRAQEIAENKQNKKAKGSLLCCCCW